MCVTEGNERPLASGPVLQSRVGRQAPEVYRRRGWSRLLGANGLTGSLVAQPRSHV